MSAKQSSGNAGQAQTLRLALAQLPMRIGRPQQLLPELKRCCAWAKQHRCDLIVFPEMSLTGYTPRDGLLDPSLGVQCDQVLDELASMSQGLAIVLSHPSVNQQGEQVIAASVLYDQERSWQFHKRFLANGNVFEDTRYFQSSSQDIVMDLHGVRLGVLICEDAWRRESWQRCADAGAEAMVVINASPYSIGMLQKRKQRMGQMAKRYAMPIAYLNWSGSDDQVLYDGNSMLLDAQGALCAQLPAFQQALAHADLKVSEKAWLAPAHPVLTTTEAADIDQALCMGLRDYLHRAGIDKVVLGLSGGIDSAVCLVVAARALGASCVTAVMLPSQYTADISVEDATELAEVLQVAVKNVPIEQGYHWTIEHIQRHAGVHLHGVAAQNVQSRLRCMVLMALANQTGAALLNTTNKSEAAVGYGTLYGDLAGAIAPLLDLTKRRVYQLAAYYCKIGIAIPARMLTREPTAELAPMQQDTDDLPPYGVIDAVVERFIELGQTQAQIIEAGLDAEKVTRILDMIRRAEYKRQQAPPALRVSPRSFGRDWRVPLSMPCLEPAYGAFKEQQAAWTELDVDGLTQ